MNATDRPFLPATLLVVDDHEFNREVLARQLGRLGYDVLQADGARAALSMLGSRRVDLVLLDMMMPDIDGFSTLRILRMRFTAGELPIVMVTAATGVAELAEAFRRGANDFVSKPVDMQALTARIGAHIAMSRTDALTGLPTRRWGVTLLRSALAEAEAAGRGLAIVAIGLQHPTPDGRRRGVGDDALRVAGARLSASLEGLATVSRLGGDGFAAVVTAAPLASTTGQAILAIFEAFSEPLIVGEREIILEARTGVANYPVDGDDVETLLAAAEVARDPLDPLERQVG